MLVAVQQIFNTHHPDKIYIPQPQGLLDEFVEIGGRKIDQAENLKAQL